MKNIRIIHLNLSCFIAFCQSLNFKTRVILIVLVKVSLTTLDFLLLDKGANVNAVDDRGFTPLTRAIKKGNYDIAELILNSSSTLDVKKVDNE